MELAFLQDARDGRGESEREGPRGSENCLALWQFSHERSGRLLVEFAEGVIEKQ
jgi:hypothetical protein